MTASTISTPTARWQQELARALRTPADLLEACGLGPEWLAAAERGARLFGVFATPSYVARMERGNPHDPLLRQVLPLDAEARDVPGFAADAVGDEAARIAPGLLHKYTGRALLITTGACAIHCRYCFRRAYPYEDEPRRLGDWEPAFTALAADESVQEVILSGGDPWMLSDARLQALTERIAAIPHVRRLRIHTRLPIVLPERVTPELLDVCRGTRLRTIVVVHANHPQELTQTCGPALERLVAAGLTVLNQAVLLRGINADADVLTALSLGLIDRGIVPYYLHQLDRVQGTAHFEVPEERGRELVAELRRRLPGYAVPQYVREVPGETHKRPLTGTAWGAT